MVLSILDILRDGQSPRLYAVGAVLPQRISFPGILDFELASFRTVVSETSCCLIFTRF
jgi:hypothetical protein